jgi:hypothetical protein
MGLFNTAEAWRLSAMALQAEMVPSGLIYPIFASYLARLGIRLGNKNVTGGGIAPGRPANGTAFRFSGGLVEQNTESGCLVLHARLSCRLQLQSNALTCRQRRQPAPPDGPDMNEDLLGAVLDVDADRRDKAEAAPLVEEFNGADNFHSVIFP